jgi:hypothetical protein
MNTPGKLCAQFIHNYDPNPQKVRKLLDELILFEGDKYLHNKTEFN